MTDLVGAYDAIVARLTAVDAGIDFPIRWQDDDQDPLPDDPSPFAFVEIIAESGFIAGYGGGRGANLYRNPATANVYVFVPVGWGLREAAARAELVAGRLRSYRDAAISCFEATVMAVGSGSRLKPPGLDSAVGNYSCAVAEIAFSYDQIG